MRTAHVGCVLVLAAFIVPGPSPGARQTRRVERPPNVVLILADDMGYAEMGVQGNTDVPTPNIDAMARAGVRFTSGYVSAPICAPTRAGLLTGRYQQRFGFETNPGPETAADPKFGLPRAETTLAERLKAAGYATGMVGKWHVGFKPELQPTARGFDEFFGFLGGANDYLPAVRRGGARSPILRGTQPVTEQEYLTDAFGREAVAFIEKHRERPFFLYLAFNAVHAPMEATAARLERFKAIENPTRRTFAAMLSAMDDNIGRVIAALRAHGLEDDTLIVFLSDNGGPTDQTTSGNHPLRGVKGQVFEGGIRIPFVMQWRGRLPAGKVDDRPVIALDVHPTILAAAGQAVSPTWSLDGVNLLPFLTGEKGGDPHDTLYWRFQRQHAIRRGDWKLVQTGPGAKPELYNLASDKGEATDLAAREPDKLKDLAAAWASWNAALMDPQWRRESGAQSAGRAGARGGQAAAAIDDRFRRLDVNKDGKLTPDEVPRPGIFGRMDANKDGVVTLEEARAYYRGRSQDVGAAGQSRPSVPPDSSQRQPTALERVQAQYGNITPKPHREEVFEQRPGEPPLKRMPDGDPARDAAGRGQVFESIVVPGITSIQAGMNGLAIADLNRDGLLDIVATYSPLRGTGGGWGAGETLRVFVNDGDFTFHPHVVRLLDSKVSPERFSRGQVPNLADVNGDGLLDLFVTRHAQMSGGQSNPNDQRIGNGLYVSDGAWDVFRDVSVRMGIQNERAYNRQPSIGDVNGDGHLDIAIGCDNIGNAMGGVPHSRLYVFEPASGTFRDIGGTDQVPDFGGFSHDSTKDKAGPDINLRDLDNDGDLDLIQSYHVDVRDLLLPFSPVEYRQGVFCWKNLLKETGTLRFEKTTGNGLASEAHLKLDRATATTTAVGKAPGLPYISLADVNNDGLLDVLAVGPASPGWAPRTEYVGGRFWRNRGGFRFEEATDASGLAALNWACRDWTRFFQAPAPRTRPGAPMDAGDRRPYFADAVFGDFDNDGWQDLVVLDRSETANPEARAALFMNRGDGTFEVKPTTFSGLDGAGIAAETADLNNDGLLDLVVAADPDNSGIALSMARYESKVYWNTGLHGGKDRHWLRLRFSGVTDAALIGARVEVVAGGMRQFRWIHANHSYKSGGALEAHFGLGGATGADLRVTLPGGKTVSFDGVAPDRFLDLNLGTGQSTRVETRTTR